MATCAAHRWNLPCWTCLQVARFAAERDWRIRFLGGFGIDMQGKEMHGKVAAALHNRPLKEQAHAR